MSSFRHNYFHGTGLYRIIMNHRAYTGTRIVHLAGVSRSKRMLRQIIKVFKKLPIDFDQYEMRYRTKGKLIAYSLVEGSTGKCALDVGCRDGYWSEKLRSKGYEVASIDLEPHCPGALRVDANESLPFDDDHFDLVWCTEVIEHVKDPAFTIAEFKRVLRPGGQLLLTTPNERFWFYRLFELLGVDLASIQNEDHTCSFTFDSLRELVGGGETFGFFPYFVYKRTIPGAAPLLSPTIVVHFSNEKPAVVRNVRQPESRLVDRSPNSPVPVL